MNMDFEVKGLVNIMVNLGAYVVCGQWVFRATGIEVWLKVLFLPNGKNLLPVFQRTEWGFNQNNCH